MAGAEQGKEVSQVKEAVLIRSEEMPDDAPTVRGYDFNKGVDMDAVMRSLLHTGFQASNFAKAVELVNQMLSWRLSDEPLKGDEDEEEKDPAYRAGVKCTIFLGFTSNMISCGVREVIRFLAQHNLVDCIVTSGGAVEEDLIKCFRPFYHGDFELDGESLRKRGLNRIGNLLVPNNHYCKLEDWLQPLLDTMLSEQQASGEMWSPSRMIDRFGKEINNEESVWYWCHKNNIPVFCPAITDGAIGDNIFVHSYRNPGLVVDVAQDIRGINRIALHAKKSGMIVLGGGLVKHHVCNANLMRNGADYTVFVNTGQEFDGSDAGARPDEARSWGKIRLGAQAVKVYADASMVFPLLVSQTFAKVVEQNKAKAKADADAAAAAQ